ncbi:MAG: 3'-5' exonuclease [Candidatus Paceibacterota bacterium]|jgi:DNA polymerase-3 subunit epsilon
MAKIIFFDCETTGVKDDCGVWQIAGVIEALGKQEQFNFFCDIFAEDEIDPVAFETNGMTDAKLSTFPDPKDVHKQFTKLLGRYVDKFDKTDKFIAVAYGADFDQRFLRKFFFNCGDKYFGSWFWHPWICMMSTSALYLRERRHELENFKLITVAKHLGLCSEGDADRFHDALWDAKICQAMYHRMANGSKEDFSRIGFDDDIPF